MTREEFIIQYVLQHKEMPSEALLQEMSEADVFGMGVVEVMKLGKYEKLTAKEQQFAEAFKNGCWVVCKKPFPFGMNFKVPRGFVLEIVHDHGEWGEYDKHRLDLMAISRVEGKGEIKKNLWRKMYEDEIMETFEILKGNVKPSVLIDHVGKPFQNSRGVTKYEHIYEVDESTLLKMD